MRIVGLLVLAAAFAIAFPLLVPKKRKVREAACSVQSARVACRLGAEPFACGWLRELDSAGPEGGDDALRAGFPALAGKRFAAVATAPAPTAFTFRSFDPHVVSFPVDWAANPYRSKTWRLELQSMGWLELLELDVAAALVRDWGGRAMNASPPLEFAWDDAGMPKRLTTVVNFLERYAASAEVLDRVTVRAALRIIHTHLYALSNEGCQVATVNHGLMETAAVLANVRKLPGLRDGDAMWDAALTRTVQQVDSSVTDDGIHVEHSPDYQLLYLVLLLNAIDAIETKGTPPASLIAARDGLFRGIVHLLQPNLTMPQFGDTENTDKTLRLHDMVAQARKQTVGDPRVLDELAWVLSAGASGTMPTTVDRVFVDGGYAAFRERWDAGAPTRVVTGHFTCTHNPLSRAHYHKDETSIELYGHGTELIVDSGKYSYDLEDPFTSYQYEVAAHNLLVIDEVTYQSVVDARIVDHGVDRDAVWVQGAHSGYRMLGVGHVRTFAFVKPDAFVVIDHLETDGPHQYAQHFHLAPGLDQVTQVDGSTVIATSSNGGPSLVLRAATPPAEIDRIRGDKTGGYQGWYFPSWRKAEATTDVVFRYRAESRGFALPVLITIHAPGESPTIPDGLSYQETPATATVSWTIGASSRNVVVPMPVR